MQDSGRIRKADADDLDTLFDIEKRCFPGETAYSYRQLRYLIIKANSSCFVETCNGCIRGYIIILYRKNSSVAGVETVNVDPCFQKKGIGKKLLRKAEQEMKKKNIRYILLEVATANKAAYRLYESSGFQKIGLLKNYYQYDHHGSYDAFRMMKTL